MRRLPRQWWSAASSLCAVLVALLVPKCPLCVAAYLACLGVGTAAVHTAALFVRPLLFAFLGVSVSLLTLGLWRSRRSRPCCHR